MNRKYLLILIILPSLLLYSCTTINKHFSHDKVEIESLYSQMKKNQYHGNELQMKINANLVINDANQSLNTHIKIKTDSIIWMSFNSGFGLEVARVIIRPDSVFIINRISKKYTAEDGNSINKLLGVNIDFYTLQSILLANDIKSYQEENHSLRLYEKNPIIDFSKRELKKEYANPNIISEPILFQSLTIDTNIMRITKNELLYDNNPIINLTCYYGDFNQYENGLLAQNINIEINSYSNFITAILSVSRIKESPQNFNFTINSNYTKVDINSIFK